MGEYEHHPAQERIIKRLTLSTAKTHLILLCVLLPGIVLAENSGLLNETGALAFIRLHEGKDAIFVKDGRGEHRIYTCAEENVIILTPSVSHDGRYMTFVVDNGKNQKAVHLLGPITEGDHGWRADDQVLLNLRGGAWPVVEGENSVLIAMPDPTALVMKRTTGIFRIQPEGVERVSPVDTNASHIRPLLEPGGTRLMYRRLPEPDELGTITESIRSDILDLGTGVTAPSLAERSLILLQWCASGDLLYMLREEDEAGSRIYELFDPRTNRSREIHRSHSRQGALSSNGRYLAVLRQAAGGGADFDIFAIDLQTGGETNLTNSPATSESLIGWLSP